MILGIVFDGVLSLNTGVNDMMCVDKQAARLSTYFIYTVLILIIAPALINSPAGLFSANNVFINLQEFLFVLLIRYVALCNDV